MSEQQQRFDQKVMTILEVACKQAGQEVPELEGVAIGLLYKYPTQDSIPSAMVVGARDRLATPDQWGRMAMVVCRLQLFLTEQYGGSLANLRQLETEMMGRIHEHTQKLKQEQPAPRPAAPEADGTVPHHAYPQENPAGDHRATGQELDPG